MIPFALLAALILASCSTAPATPKTVAPTWTSQAVSTDGAQLIFVLHGAADSSVPDLAYSAMASYLDLPITPTMPSVTSQAIQKFLKTMSQTPPSDQYVQGTLAWWRVVLSKPDWDAAKAQLEALIAAAADPSTALEAQADELLRQGRYVDAVSGYVSAAAAAVGDGHPPLPNRFQSTLKKAHDVLEHFTLSSTTPAQTTRVGQPFASTFDVKLTYGVDASAPTIPGVALRFSYKARVNGHIAEAGSPGKTDDQGTAKFSFPVPDFGTRDNVVVVIDVTPWIQTLASVPQDFQASLSTIELAAGDRKLQLPYTVESAAKQVPLIVALADLDEKGSLLRRQETTSALITALQKSGFQSSGIQINLSLLKSPSDGVILTAWKFQGRTTGRAVYGTVGLVGVTVDGSQFKAEVAGTLKIADLATNKPVYQLKTSSISSATDRATSITLAFRTWAEQAAATLDAELP